MSEDAVKDNVQIDVAIIKEHLNYQDETLDRQDKQLDDIQDKLDRNYANINDKVDAFIAQDNQEDSQYASKSDVKEVAGKVDGVSNKLFGGLTTAVVLMAGWMFYLFQHFSK